MIKNREQNFNRKEKFFTMKKDYKRKQERNDKYFFYQNQYTRFEKSRDRDREIINFNFLRFYINQIFDKYNFVQIFNRTLIFRF